MLYTYRQMQDLVLAEARLTISDPTQRGRVQSWLNAIKWELETLIDLPMLNSTYQFSATAADTEIILPSDVSAIINVRTLDRAGDRSYARALQETSADEFDWDIPLNRTEANMRSTPERYRWKRISGIRSDVVGSGAYTAESSSAADLTAGLRVVLVGYRDSARQDPVGMRANVTANPTAIGTMSEAIAASKNIVTQGLVTIKKGVAIVATIPPLALSVEQFVLEVNPLWNDIYLHEIRYRRRSPPMILDEDAPWLLPPEGEGALIKGGKWMALAFTDDSRAPQAKQDYEEAKGLFLASQKPNLVEHAGFTFGGGGFQEEPHG